GLVHQLSRFRQIAVGHIAHRDDHDAPWRRHITCQPSLGRGVSRPAEQQPPQVQPPPGPLLTQASVQAAVGQRQDGHDVGAAGGGATVIEHTHSRPVRTRADLIDRVRYLADRSLVDFGLAAHITPSALALLPDLWREGAAYFKAFTCTTHGIDGMTNGELLAAFQAVAELDSAVLVHSEDEAILADAGRLLRAQGVDGG